MRNYLFLALFFSACLADLYLSQNATGTECTNTAPCGSLSDVILKIDDDTTIVVSNGTYYVDDIFPDFSITLTADDDDNTGVFFFPINVTTSHCLTFSTTDNDISISGITFVNCFHAISASPQSPIDIDLESVVTTNSTINTSGEITFTIEDSIFNNLFSASLIGDSEASLSNCTFQNDPPQLGLSITGKSKITIEKSFFDSTSINFLFNDTDSSVEVSNSNWTSSSTGVSTDNLITMSGGGFRFESTFFNGSSLLQTLFFADSKDFPIKAIKLSESSSIGYSNLFDITGPSQIILDSYTHDKQGDHALTGGLVSDGASFKARDLTILNSLISVQNNMTEIESSNFKSCSLIFNNCSGLFYENSLSDSGFTAIRNKWELNDNIWETTIFSASDFDNLFVEGDSFTGFSDSDSSLFSFVGKNISLSGCSFSNNNSTQSGSCVSVDAVSFNSFELTFDGCHSTTFGGAVQLSGNTTAYFEKTSISNSVATTGSAINCCNGTNPEDCPSMIEYLSSNAITLTGNTNTNNDGVFITCRNVTVVDAPSIYDPSFSPLDSYSSPPNLVPLWVFLGLFVAFVIVAIIIGIGALVYIKLKKNDYDTIE